MGNEDGHSSSATVVRHVWVRADMKAFRELGRCKIKVRFDIPIGCVSSGGGHGSGGETNPFCNRCIREAVVLPGFVREPEKGEENDRT